MSTEKQIDVTKIFTLAEKPYAAIQGEGRFVGLRMMFVRIQGCPVGCTWCDSYFTWSPFAEAKIPEQIRKTVNPIAMTFDELVGLIRDSGVKHVWFTGGEPTTQCELIADFIEQNKKHLKDVKFHICTAGYKYDARLFDLLDYVTVDMKAPSSKTVSKGSVVEKIYTNDRPKLEFKMVVANTDADKNFARAMVHSFEDVPFTVQPLYLSEPILSSLNAVTDTPLSVDYFDPIYDQQWNITDFANWVSEQQYTAPNLRLGLQLHKHLYPNQQRGI